MMTFKEYLDFTNEVPEIEGAEGEPGTSGSSRFMDALKYASDYLLELRDNLASPEQSPVTFDPYSSLEQVQDFANRAADFAAKYLDDPSRGPGATFV